MRIKLFWKLFFAILMSVVLVSILSLYSERWLRARTTEQAIDQHIAQLVEQRHSISAALREDDLDSVRTLFAQQPTLAREIRITSLTGEPLFWTPRQHAQHHSRRSLPPNAAMHESLDIALSTHQDERETLIHSANGQTYVLTLTPRLSLHDLTTAAQQRTTANLLIILTISALICWLLSRHLSIRINRLQSAVSDIATGDYQAAATLVNTRSDELDELGNDIASMAAQLTEHQRARQQMLSDIAHELRSPLARMDVALALAQDKAPQAAQPLAQISKESARMNALIAQIIRIQQAGLQPQKDTQRVNLVVLLMRLCDDLRYEGRERGCSVSLEAPDALMIVANPERLASALDNILRNALAHSPEHGVVSVVARGNAAEIDITICDQGSGVAEADLARIFMPFVRLDRSRTRKTGGYGLGLAIARAVIVDELGGSLDACNRRAPEQGLQVNIRLKNRSGFAD